MILELSALKKLKKDVFSIHSYSIPCILTFKAEVTDVF